MDALFHAVSGLAAACWKLAGLGDKEEEQLHSEGIPVYIPARACFGSIPKVFSAVTRGRNLLLCSQSLRRSGNDKVPGAEALKMS